MTTKLSVGDTILCHDHRDAAEYSLALRRCGYTHYIEKDMEHGKLVIHITGRREEKDENCM